MTLLIPGGASRFITARAGTGLETPGYFKDTFDRGGSATLCVPMGLDWVDMSTYSTGFDPVGIINGSVATREVTRDLRTGKPYLPNPNNVRGAEDYLNSPTYLLPGIGGAYRETGSTKQIVSGMWHGLVGSSPTYGQHSEFAPGVHFVPGSVRGEMGAWASMLSGQGIILLGYVGDPCERFEIVSTATFTHNVPGTPRKITIDTNGTGVIVLVDDVQLSLVGFGGNPTVGMGRYPVPVELQGSTKHGFTIDQHIVNYSGGAPSPANLQAAPSFSEITMVTP